MDKILSKAQSLLSRLEQVSSKICPGNPFKDLSNFDSAVNELEDIILDFKTLAYKSDPNSPIYHEISREDAIINKRSGEYDYTMEVKRIGYLLGKFIQYTAEE